MNINLASHGSSEVYPSMQHDLDESRVILEGAGYDITGPAVLVPAPDTMRGVYQAWWPVWINSEQDMPGADHYEWMHVTSEGQVVFTTELPAAEDVTD